MELKELQNGVAEHGQWYGKEYDVRMDEEFAVLKLGEEYGEFMQAYMIHKNMCRPVKRKNEADSMADLSKELADVLACTLFLAHTLGVDVEAELKKAWSQRITTNT